MGQLTDNKWIDVVDFPNYEIHPSDGIRRKGREKPLRGRNWFGYPKVTLMRDGKKHEKRIHKLTGEHFIPNPNNLPIVNHKDSDRSNHSVDNLEWVDNSGNQLHRWQTQKANVKKKTYTREYGLKKTAESMLEKRAATLISKAADRARVKRLKGTKNRKFKDGISSRKQMLIDARKKTLDNEYKSAGMSPLRRAVNHALPFNSVVF